MADVFSVKQVKCAAAQMVLHCWKGMEGKDDNTREQECESVFLYS